MELIRPDDGGKAYALVSPLITTGTGVKMGKTEAGAVWLDPALTLPYDYYQFWINTEDADVGRFLALYTFLPLEQVRALSALAGAELRRAKEVLAFEATRIAHGEDEAERARAAARALFGGASEEGAAVPTTPVPRATLKAGMPLVDLLVEAGLAKSKGEARRLIAQGGAYINGEAATDPEARVGVANLADGALVLRAGKKRYVRIVADG